MVSRSLVDRGCWTFVACGTCVLENAGGAVVCLPSWCNCVCVLQKEVPKF